MLSQNFIAFSLLDELLITHSSNLSVILQYNFTDFILPTIFSQDVCTHIQLLLQSNSPIGHFTSIQILTNTFNTPELVTFNLQDQTNNTHALQAIYHYSIPTVKLFYPEPFIAAASFMHTDI